MIAARRRGVRLGCLALLALMVTLLPLSARGGPSDGRVYVTMDDGVEIAVYLQFPRAWDGTTPLPVILQYDGYEGGGGPAWHNWLDRKNYVVAHAGVRGAGCSSGQWGLFSERQAKDGAAVVEWLGTRRWSNGNVGMVGHSYPAYMALFTAAQRPSHLRAISVSGTGDDIYRDVVYPGGIPSRLFGPLWLLAARPESDYLATIYNVQQGKPDCLVHHLQRPPESPGEHSFVAVTLQDQDSDFWYVHSPKSVVDRITVPTQIQAQSGDEQILGSTRGSALLFQQLRTDAKQLIITNGDHNAWDDGAERVITDTRMAWFDRYVRGIDTGVDRQPKVRVLLESSYQANGKLVPTGEVSSNVFPLAGTRWTTLFAAPGGALSEAQPRKPGGDVFVLGTGRQILDPTLSDYAAGRSTGQELTWADGPDSVIYRTPKSQTTQVVAGPMLATVYARIWGVDANLYAGVIDEAPDGARSIITRGYLKASHRAVDGSRSGWDGVTMYRPYHPHTNPELVPPGDIVRYDIEIMPAGFVIRPGHRLILQILAAPALQTYALLQPAAPALAEIVRDAKRPTSLLLPIVDVPAGLGAEPACGTVAAVFCAKPAF